MDYQRSFLSLEDYLENQRKTISHSNELDMLRDIKSFLLRLDLVRDIFVFCCYTGLAYAVVKQLKQDEMVIGVNGERWIKMARKKTKAISSIHILPTTEEIIQNIVKILMLLTAREYYLS